MRCKQISTRRCIRGWTKGCTWGYTWVVLEDAHVGSLVSVQECLNVEEKDSFDVAVDDPLDGATDGAPESTLKGTPKNAPRDLHNMY